MRFIDKTKYRAAGIEITSQFLQTHCLEPSGRHQGVRYNQSDSGDKETFCLADKGRYKKRLTKLLFSEQGGLCCYCLRKLKINQHEEFSDQAITLEHIIPRSYTSANDVAYYQTAPGLTPADVVVTDVYEDAAYTQQAGIHPHKVAYNNFVVSCNGTFPDVLNRRAGKQKICCNVKRQNKEVYPVYFLDNVADYVEYLRDGDVQAVQGSPEEKHVQDLIDNTNLQCDSLKYIRFLWYVLRTEPWAGIVACNNSANDRYRLLCTKLYEPSIDIELANVMLTKFSKQKNWETFMLYSAFYDIMKSKYP